MERLRTPAAIFLLALLVHGADHARRGLSILSPEVFWLGNAQLAVGIVAVVLAFRNHRWAPALAVGIGFVSAAGFTAAHLLPHWGVFSDSFTGSDVAPHVTGFSWFAALFEIAADLAFGAVGLRVLRRRGAPTPVVA